MTDFGNDQLSYCEYWCGPLTNEQQIMVRHHVGKKTFLGVGRPVGFSKYQPMVLIGKTPNVLDKAGYYQLAASDGRRLFVCDQEGGKP